MGSELAKIDSFRHEVAVAETIEEIKMLSTKGELLAEMAKKLNITKKGQDDLGRTRVLLETRKRELIEKMFPVKGTGSNQYQKVENSQNVSLADFGITHNESSNAKIIKEKPDLVEKVMNEIEESNEVITPKAVAAKVRKKIQEISRQQQAEEGAKIETIDVDFRLGDFEEVFSDLPDASVDCIITDPPYPYEYIECWTKLSRFAKRVLKPNGFCIAYSGQMHLPEVIQRMSEYLDYYWTFAVYHEGQTQIVNGVNLICRWKPVLIFQNGKRKLPNTFQDYFISQQREKDGHDWQQGKSGVSYLIEMFTNPDQLICEPFAGSGTTIKAARELKRNIIAAEIDEITYNIAKAGL
jgi:DNA modification methylase